MNKLIPMLTVVASLSFGCALLDVPKNILGGLQKTQIAHHQPFTQQQQEQVSPSAAATELTELRSILDRMVSSGELTQNASDLKYMQEKNRIEREANAAAAQEQQQYQMRQQQMMNAFKGLNCYGNTLGATFCY